MLQTPAQELTGFIAEALFGGLQHLQSVCVPMHALSEASQVSKLTSQVPGCRFADVPQHHQPNLDSIFALPGCLAM